MRISMPFTGNYMAAAGLLQGANQAQERAMRNQMQTAQMALAAKQQALAERAQAAKEQEHGEELGFERFKLGETNRQQTEMEKLRDALLGAREEKGRAFQAGESALGRSLQERLASQSEAGATARTGMGIASNEKIAGQRETGETERARLSSDLQALLQRNEITSREGIAAAGREQEATQFGRRMALDESEAKRRGDEAYNNWLMNNAARLEAERHGRAGEAQQWRESQLQDKYAALKQALAEEAATPTASPEEVKAELADEWWNSKDDERRAIAAILARKLAARKSRTEAILRGE